MKKEHSVCNEEHYNNLFRELSEKIYSYVYYRVGNEELAKDIVQEVFIKLWQNCEKVTYNKAKYYLLRLAKNKTIDIYRTKKIKIEYDTSKHQKTEKETPQYKMEYTQYEQQLNEALAKMPEKHRITFLMNRIDGIKYQDISETLGVSVKTVEYRMQKALRFLRKELGIFNK